ncbi:hypothetical protein ACI6QG_10835 [Roseococcus sp. DSY-14]|uniref:hypothetical protein n=1 Tax=Roseococcus sp. DSY-14 TaxID=3369650 RepID=UPI00387AE74A
MTHGGFPSGVDPNAPGNAARRLPVAGNRKLAGHVAGARASRPAERTHQMRGILLWLIGIPIPIILLLWLFGVLG